MAPGRMRKWLRLLPVQSGSHPHHARQSDTSNSASSSTEATATIVASDLTRNVVNLVPPQIETTSQAATSSEPVYRLNSKMAEEYMKKIKRFRILVMGRANAGKTTILQRVCNSTDKPEIFDGMGNKIDSVVVQGTLAHGYHDIKHELVFRSNPGFLFHDSCGFEAGSTQQFDQMKDFVVGHAAARSVKERIHAIWFCIPMTDYHRTVTAAEQKFFDECDTGHVPVIVLVTKADALHLDAIQELEDGGLEIEEAEKKLTQQEGELLENRLAYIKHNLDKCKFPPRGYVVLEKMDEESANTTTLMQCTANMLSEEGLQRLLVSTQQSTITLCVEYAVKKTLRRRMELGLKDRLQINVKRFEYDLLGWFPNCGVTWE
ncbi:hypothetical protein EDC04DRAFT_378830 [Pisolithus marmoratus]|nr:hypothetical protein EDC04DRAFT_378830 [Pisolithus marmoratus]